MQLIKDAKVTLCKSTVAAGTSGIIDATVIDMLDYEGVLFIASFGAITSGAVTKLKAAALATSSPTATTDDLEGSSTDVPDTADDTVVVLDIYKPTLRYIRPCVSRATQNSVLNSIIAIQYGPKKKPVTQAASVTTTTVLVSPINGTA